MNTNDGRIHPYSEVESMPQAEQAKYIRMTLDPTPIQRGRGRVSRNDPCPCGSGKKFKKCHWTGAK